jgi:diguanylate cyclase (GGDEF)-like protein/PAS domain S-box-containing protein
LRRSAPSSSPPAAPSYEELYEDAPCGYLSLLGDGTVVQANRTLLRSLGRSADEVVGRVRLQDLMAPGSRIYHATHWGPKLDLQGEVREVPVDLVRADGERQPVLLNAVVGPAGGDAAATIRCSVFDASDRRRYERELVAARDTERDARRRAEHLARHDPLTELANRLLVDERISRAIVRARRDGTSFAVLLLDLDEFKLVNDSLGHHAGDDLLRSVARRLSGALPDADTIGRIGGDEFVVLVDDLAAAGGADAIAERIRAVLEPPFDLEGARRGVRASVGVAVSDGRADDLRLDADLLRDADIAMYRAKALRHVGHVVFDVSMRAHSVERLRMETELRSAIAEGQLRVVYQPVVSTDDERIVSMEALVRWHHPEHGVVPPGVFITAAEELGLIGEIGAFVLEESCRQLAVWRRDGVAAPDVGVAVNVSARQLEEPRFAGDVADVIGRSGLAGAPHLLGLEVTETLLMDSGEEGAAVLRDLSAMGVGVLLDDFGTGFSSLARLKRLPVDTLKIDRVFVAGLGDTSGDDDAIVGAVVAMAAQLGLRVVAEGVETRAQLACLQRMRCDRVQGFLFSRPLPADEMAQLLRQDSASADAVGGRAAEPAVRASTEAVRRRRRHVGRDTARASRRSAP